MSVNPVSYSIDLPFKITPGKAIKVVGSTDPRYWRNKVLALLTTNNNERLFYPIFGASLANVTLFENSGDAIDMAKLAIAESFARWLPSLKFIDMTADYDSTSGKLGLVVMYRLPSGNDDYAKISIGLTSSYGGTVSVSWNG